MPNRNFYYNEKTLRKMANEIIRRDKLKTTATQIQFMTKYELFNFISIHGHDDLPDSENPNFIFSLTSSNLLKQIISGKIDIIQIAKNRYEGRNLI